MSHRAFAVELEPQPHECADSMSCGLAPQAFGSSAHAATVRLMPNEITFAMAQSLPHEPLIHAGAAAHYDSDVSELDLPTDEGASGPSDGDVMKRLFVSVFKA